MKPSCSISRDDGFSKDDGFDEQIFGSNGQILGQDQSDQGASYAALTRRHWHILDQGTRGGGPTDAQVMAGTILGVASMFARGRHW
jgi:hypothetical protein